MRLFSDAENKIIKKIVKIFREAKPGSLAELQVARLLRKELKFFALQWSINPIDEVILYIPKRDFDDLKKIDRQYFDIADFIYFIEELESLGFIKLQNIPSNDEEDFTILYDRDKYKYEKEDNTFWEDVNFKNGNQTIKGEAVVPLKEWRKFNTDFAKDLQRCARCIVYPLPLARDYVDNKLKTLELRQFNKQFYTAFAAAILGGISAIVAIIALIITIRNANKPTTIDRMDLERLEYAIKANHLAEPLEVFTGDTLVVKQVPTQTKTDFSK